MSKMPCSSPIRRAASSSAIPASGSPSETRSGPRIARARPSAAVAPDCDRAGDGRLGDLARLAVVAGTHQPAGQADEDVRALGRRRLLGHQPDGLAMLGLRLLAAVLGPQAVADPRVEVARPGPVARSRRSRSRASRSQAIAWSLSPASSATQAARRRSSIGSGRSAASRTSAGSARLEADRQAVLAAGGGVRVDRLGGLGRVDAGAERLRRPIGGQPVVGQLGGGPGRARIGQLGSLGEHDGEAFVDAATLGRQEVAFEDLAQQGVARPKRARGRIGHEDARP